MVLLEKIQSRIADLPRSKRQIIEKQILKTRGVIEDRRAMELAPIYTELYTVPDAEVLTVLNKSIAKLQGVLILFKKVNAFQIAV